MSDLMYENAPKPLRRAAKALYLQERKGLLSVPWKELPAWAKNGYVQRADVAVAAYAKGTRKTFERQLLLPRRREIEVTLDAYEQASALDTLNPQFDRGYALAVKGLTTRLRDLLKQ